MQRQHYRATLAQFHRAFGVEPFARLTPVEQLALIPLRATLIAEETRELFEAISDTQQDPTEQNRAHLAKEAADLLYVTAGTAHLLGLPFVDPAPDPFFASSGAFVHDLVIGQFSRDAQSELDWLFRAMDHGYSQEHLTLARGELAPTLQSLARALDAFCVSRGIPLREVFDAVHASNMSKLDPVTKKPVLREDGKVLKGAGYFEPDVHQVLRQAA
ncbi:hypothetical protein ACIOHC_36120 [Streptomyces sp. NPDC088252]|uniref:hypothetical protein n=1 Tax=Streptomyces sp. NPDC088252 TaxID=3365845 RepID=UPI00382F742A